jgi:predicted  nucleic acid-binding Zn-ribbon protein
MDSEKVLSGLIGGAVTGVIAVGGALVNKGRREEQFDRLRADMAKLEKSVSEKVPVATFEKEIEAIHVRMSRTQREQAAAIAELDKKVDALAGEIKFMSGVLSTLPSKLDELTKEMRSR